MIHQLLAKYCQYASNQALVTIGAIFIAFLILVMQRVVKVERHGREAAAVRGT